MVAGKELLDLIFRRQSDREYRNQPVEDEKLGRIIEAGRMAPSACNAQPWKFIVVTEGTLLKELADATREKLTGMNSFAIQAPVMVVLVREKPNFSSKFGSTVKNKDYSRIDIGIAAENICLQAAAEGLGSCMIGWFDEKRVKSVLGIPASRRVELIITLGYSVSKFREKRRKPPEMTVSYNKY